MTNMFKKVKDAMEARKAVKKLQRELESQTVEFASGGIRVSARADMSIANIAIDPAIVDPARVVKLETLLASAINGALKGAKQKAEEVISKQSGGGLTDLLRANL